MSKYPETLEVEDELSPNFIEQEGASMHVSLSRSGIGYGLCFEFYDEYGNDIDSVFYSKQRKSN